MTSTDHGSGPATDPTLPGPALVAESTSKTFFGNTVLDSFHLTLWPGEVHALLGHNGSGKSTFIKILSGYHTPDSGSSPIRIGDAILEPGDPDSSHAAGLRFVHQDLGLIGDLSVLENLRLGSGAYATAAGRRIRWRDERRRARELLGRFGLDMDPEEKLAHLSAVEQAEVAISRAVEHEEQVEVLVLDEPTARLPDSEVAKLFSIVERVSERGVAVLYVTHRMEEVHAISDMVTVLRSGQIVGRGTTDELSRSDLVRLIVGDREASAGATSRPSEAAAAGSASAGTALQLLGVRGTNLHDVDLDVAPSEVVGIAGLVGSGVEAVPRLLMGEAPVLEGTVLVEGRAPKSLAPSVARREGLVVLPSRRDEKLIQEMTVKENLTLTMLGRYWRRVRFEHAAERQHARELVRTFDIACDSIESMMRTLSGGNQQKVAVTRSLQLEPSVLVLDEPTQGIDVHGKGEIVHLLRQAAGRGVAVLICSSDLEELEVACDRIAVMRGGRIVTELRGAEISRERVLKECYGGGE